MKIEFELSNDTILDWAMKAEPMSKNVEYTYTGKIPLSVNGKDVSDDVWVTVDLCEFTTNLKGRMNIVETRKQEVGVTYINDTTTHDQFNTKYSLSEREADMFWIAHQSRLMTEEKYNNAIINKEQ